MCTMIRIVLKIIQQKEGISTFHGSMDGAGNYNAKRNKPVIERQKPHDLTHMWNLMKWTNKENGDRFIESRLTALGGWEGGGREQNGKRTCGHGPQCGDYGGNGVIRELNDNGKK